MCTRLRSSLSIGAAKAGPGNFQSAFSAELAEAAGDAVSVLASVPAPAARGVPPVATSDGRAYSDRTRRLASRAFDLIAARDRAAAEPIW